MLLKLNFESELPIYLQIRNQIVEGIAALYLAAANYGDWLDERTILTIAVVLGAAAVEHAVGDLAGEVRWHEVGDGMLFQAPPMRMPGTEQMV